LTCVIFIMGDGALDKGGFYEAFRAVRVLRWGSYVQTPL
jgi:TPP-dependent pyruvate/acetoin dehydrogenase alpha subunit